MFSGLCRSHSILHPQRVSKLIDIFDILTILWRCADCAHQWSARVVFSISRREWEFLRFNLVHRDETENSWHLLSGFETRPRKNFLQSRASRRDRDLLSSLSGIETRTRIPLIWSRFSRRDREFWNLPSFPEIRLERPHYFACNFWEANYIKCRAPHFARCARLTWITWLPCISSIAFIPCLICITCITWITCITFITWLSITSLNSLLIRIFKMYNLPIEANLVCWISFQPIGVKLTSWILNWIQVIKVKNWLSRN